MKRHAAPIIAAVLLLLPVLYVGSYLALVVPGGRRVPRPNTSYKSFWDVHHYRLGGGWSDRFFWPLEQIDRKVRPEAWEPVVRYRHWGEGDDASVEEPSD